MAEFNEFIIDNNLKTTAMCASSIQSKARKFSQIETEQPQPSFEQPHGLTQMIGLAQPSRRQKH